MEVYRCIRTRLAIKSFIPDSIPEPAVKKILRAARWAPSQRNRQPWHLIVIRDRQTLKQISSLTSSGTYIAEAPLAIAIVMENARMPQFEAGRLIENMLLVAWSEGIGTSLYLGFGLRPCGQRRRAVPGWRRPLRVGMGMREQAAPLVSV